MPAPGLDATTHVAQAIVPVVVIGPPVIGAVVAMLVTVPEPPPPLPATWVHVFAVGPHAYNCPPAVASVINEADPASGSHTAGIPDNGPTYTQRDRLICASSDRANASTNKQRNRRFM